MRTTTIHAWMTTIAESVKDRRDYLTQLDAAIGDGDHGVNMDRGFEAVGKALAAQDGSLPPGKLLTVAGKTLLDAIEQRPRALAVPAVPLDERGPRDDQLG